VASLEGYPVKSSQVKSSQADSVVRLGPGSILEGVPRGYAVQGPGGFGVTGLDWTGLDWTGLDWTGLDWTGLDWTGLDWTGLDWTGLDWTGLDWTGDWFWQPRSKRAFVAPVFELGARGQGPGPKGHETGGRGRPRPEGESQPLADRSAPTARSSALMAHVSRS